jgi:hypothetical protein
MKHDLFEADSPLGLKFVVFRFVPGEVLHRSGVYHVVCRISTQ